MLGPEVLPTEITGKDSHISNQVKVVEPGSEEMERTENSVVERGLRPILSWRGCYLGWRVAGTCECG